MSAPGKRDMVGGHSPGILKNPSYEVEIISRNSDGTITVKWIKNITPDARGVSNVKYSTLAPEVWSDAKIMGAVKQVGSSNPIESNIRGSSHVGTVDGVQWQIIKDPSGNVTSAFPTGGRPPLKLTGPTPVAPTP